MPRTSIAWTFARRSLAAAVVYFLLLRFAQNRLWRWALLGLPSYLLLLYASYALLAVGKGLCDTEHPVGEKESLVKEVEEAIVFLRQNGLFPTESA